MERKEAIEVIKKNWPDSSFTMLREALETLIPELKESEDEKIMKAIKYGLDHVFTNNTTVFEVTKEQCLAWLEKQGEQKPADKYNIRGIKSKHAEGKLGEMIKNLKSSDKIEPKFHEGEWVVWDNKITCHIGSVYHGKFSLMYTITDTNNMVRSYSVKGFDSNARLWDITKDAKDGDVLAVESENDYSSPFIAIYKERGLDFFNSHCFVAFDGKFYVGENGHSTEDIHPATKEQRDLLFQKMHDAGYEWNIESKELKKIVDKEQIKKNLQDNSFRRMFEQKPAEWSEEDERLFQIVIDILDRQNHLGNISRTDLIACVRKLKSLRPQPKQELGEEDEVGLANVMWAIKQARTIAKDECDMGNLWYAERWIKSLRPKKQWKPSELQIEALESATANCAYSEYVDCLKELQEQLKQL